MPTETISAAEYRAQNARVSLRPRRRNKFGAKPIVIDGHRFPSRLEGRRYGVLKTLERAGLIRGLKLQRRFVLDGVAGQKATVYIADFDYEERAGAAAPFSWRWVVEDAKGFETPAYKIKRALFLQQHPKADFREIRR